MRVVEVKKIFENCGIKFLPGHSYVMAEDIEAQYRALVGDALGMSYPIETIYKPYKGQDLSGKKLLVFRTGGIGDLCFLNGAIRILKKKFPTSSLRAASACKQPLENLTELDALYDMPFDAELFKETDYQLFFQGIIEGGSDESKRTHAVDMFLSYFGIDGTHIPDEEKVPRLTFTKAEIDWCQKTIAGWGIKDTDYVIGVQMETSAPLRNFPKEKMKAFIDVLSKEPNTKVVVIGSEQHDMIGNFFKGGSPNIFVATKFNVRQSIVLCTRYNLVIAPDSFIIQIAGALDKPLVGLYGPFPSEVRMKYFKNSIGLDPSVPCAPCYKHDFRGCVKGFPSPCFTQISVDDVLQAADLLKFKFTGAHFTFMAPLMREPNLQEVSQYMMGADKGLCFFPGRYKPTNAVTVDPNPFVEADINDLAKELRRDSVPFVLYMNEFQPKYQPVYANSKNMVRPGGFYIVYVREGNEQFYQEIKRDIGGSFVLLFTKFDPGTREILIAGKKDL